MKTLRPPSTLTVKYAVLVYDRNDGVFVLALPDGSTYELGEAQESLTYLKRVFPTLGETAMDYAYNFGAAQIMPGLERVVQVDLGEELTKQAFLKRMMFPKAEDKANVTLMPVS